MHAPGSEIRRSLLNRSLCCSASPKDGQLERVNLSSLASCMLHFHLHVVEKQAVSTEFLTCCKPLASLSWSYVYEQDSVEMYVASGNDGDAESSMNMLRVAPPRSQSSASVRNQPGSGDGLQRLVPTDHTKALRAELRVTGAELRSKSAELSEAKQIIQ